MGPELAGMAAEEQAYLEAQREVLRNLIEAANAQALASSFTNKNLERSASDVRHKVKEKDPSEPFKGKVGDSGSMKHKAAIVDMNVKEIVKAYKENRGLILVSSDTTSGKVVRNIISKISDPDMEIDQNSAPYLYKILQKAITNQISDPLQVLNKYELKELQQVNTQLHKYVVEGLVQAAQESGTADRDIEKFVKEVGGVEDGGRGGRERMDDFNRDWQYFLSGFYDDLEKPVIEALYSTEKFSTYVDKARAYIKEKRPDIVANEAEVDRLTGEKIEAEIVGRFSKLFLRVDKEKPTEFFDNIVTSGFTESIQTAFDRLKRRLSLLAEQIERGQTTDTIKGFKPSRKEYISEDVLRDIKGGNTSVENRVVPYPLGAVTNTADFLNGVLATVNQENDTRKYLHNVRTLFTRGASKDGFWPTLAGYASQFNTVDLDNMRSLPDSEMFMTATRLYTKYIEEALAKNNWIHPRDLFTEGYNTVRTGIEKKVAKDLKMLFKEDITLTNGGEDIWRIERAVNMGVGIAKGVLLTEVESAAYADPNLNPDGSAHFGSYYTNDAAALAPINPIHQFWRWQAEATMSPVAFMPVQGITASYWKSWNHKELWDRMKAYKEAYIKGEDIDKLRKPGELLFIDILPNWGKVGSIISRGGWRDEPAYEGWLMYKHRDGNIQNGLDYFKSWKSIENIGFEMLLDFVNNRIDKDFYTNSPVERDALLNHVYKKYINPNSSDPAAGVRNERDRVKDAATKAVDDKIKQKLELKSEREKLINEETYKRILYKGLAGVLRQRIPSKIIRFEKNKYTKGGVRAWEALRRRFDSEWSIPEFEGAMEDIMLVESEMRRRVSNQMENHIIKQPGNNKTLWDFEGSYVVDQEVIKDIIKDSARQEKAMKLFNAMNESYLNDQAMNELAEKIRDRTKYFPYAIATEELETKFLSFMKTGRRTLERAIVDTGGVETNMYGPLKDFFSALHAVSVDPKRDISKLIEPIAKIKAHMEDMHGKNDAHRMVSNLAGMVIAYFQKDTTSRLPGGGIATLGQKNSVAAEYVKLSRGVWEWDKSDCDKFITELEKLRLLPPEPYDLGPSGGPGKEAVYLNFFGKKLKIGEKNPERKYDYEYNAKKTRRDFGISGKNITYEILTKYLPIAVALMLWQYMSKAFKGDDEKR